jgi:hypothetical protein
MRYCGREFSEEEVGWIRDLISTVIYPDDGWAMGSDICRHMRPMV